MGARDPSSGILDRAAWNAHRNAKQRARDFRQKSSEFRAAEPGFQTQKPEFQVGKSDIPSGFAGNSRQKRFTSGQSGQLKGPLCAIVKLCSSHSLRHQPLCSGGGGLHFLCWLGLVSPLMYSPMCYRAPRPSSLLPPPGPSRGILNPPLNT